MLLYDKQRKAHRLQRCRYLEEVSHSSCSHDCREAYRSISEVSAPACSGNQACTLHGTSSVRSEVTSKIDNKKILGIPEYFFYCPTNSERAKVLLWGCECVDTSTSGFFKLQKIRTIKKISECFLLLVHTLSVCPCFCIDTDEVAFVNEHRHLNGCSSFESYGI